MDETRAAALLDKLVNEGLIEENDGEIGPTRRWNARVQAAGEKLNIEVARTGVQPDGNPLVLAVSAALRDGGAALDAADFDDAVRMLVTLELSRMTADKRSRYGFDVAL